MSQFSKNRISKILKKEPDEIAVIYDGLSDCFADFCYDKEQDMKAKGAYGLPEKYILCLSTLEPRKNMRLLVEAFSELIKEKKIDTNLVLAGRKGWLMDDCFPTWIKKLLTGFISRDLWMITYCHMCIGMHRSSYSHQYMRDSECLQLRQCLWGFR